MRRAAEAELLRTGGERLGLMVTASRLLPDRLVGRVAQRAVPPVLAARLAGRFEPERAARLVRHVEPAYLADMAAHLDPRSIEGIIPALPTDVMADVTAEMLPREDWVTMGRMVGLVPPDELPALLEVVDDDVALLRIAFFLERRDRLGAIVDRIPDRRLARLPRVAAERDLWAEALSLPGFLDPTRRARVAGLAVDQPEWVLESLVVAAQEQHLWAPVLALVGHLDDDRLPAVAGLGAIRDAEVLDRLLAAADRPGGWATLVRVLAAMEPPVQREIDALLDGLLAGDRARALAAAAEAEGLRGRLGPVADRLPEVS